MTATSRWATLEGAELGTFRQNAPGRLAADLEAVLRTPAGIAVQKVRDEIFSPADHGRAHLAGGMAELRGDPDRRSVTAGERHGPRPGDHRVTRPPRGAVADGLRNLGLLLAVLSVVTALGLVLRRSITRPLSEVSEGARTLSGGDLAFDVSYAGRDEIGDVAAAFRDLHVTAERLVGEIRATNAAIGDNRLDHRADVGAFEGTWAQLLAGMNDTTAAFASLHRGDLAASRARIVASSDQTETPNRARPARRSPATAGITRARPARGAAGRAAGPARAARGTGQPRPRHHRGTGGTPGDVPRHPSRHLVAGRARPGAEGAGPPVPGPVRLDVRVQARLPERAEVAAYFVVSEALANVAKHARASVVEVQVEVRDGALAVSISDDGIGGADPSRGSGLIGLTDRVEASGGTISISSHAGAGTQITAELPIAS